MVTEWIEDHMRHVWEGNDGMSYGKHWESAIFAKDTRTCNCANDMDICFISAEAAIASHHGMSKGRGHTETRLYCQTSMF